MADVSALRRAPVTRALLLGGLVALGVALRLYHINAPPIDYLAWRDTQTLMVARNFFRDGLNIFLPAVDWRTTHAVHPHGTVGGTEFMLVPWLTALLYHVFGIQYWVGRVAPIFFSALGAVFFFKLAERFYGVACAAIATLLLTVLPYYLYCGRCQMPESFALAMTFAALYRYDIWLETRARRDFALAAAAALLMLLAKPMMGTTAIPMAFITFHRLGWKTFRDLRLYLFAACVGLPFAAYMYWTSHIIIPETGISFSGPGMFHYRRWLTQPKYYADMAKSLWAWALTPPAVVLACLGAALPRPRGRAWFALAWFVGAMALFVLMPGGAAANGYYQAIVEPPCALLAGRALAWALTRGRALRAAGAVALVVAVAWPFSVSAVLFEPRYEADMACGIWVRENTPDDALVLTSSPNPTTLYFADRKGWTAWQEHYGKGAVFNQALIDKVIPLGASVLAMPVPGDWFDNAYFPDYNGIRDALYERFRCHKDPRFTVFFLTEPADLALPPDGAVTFGTLDARRYLRGAWGPDQTGADGIPFTTLGPAKQAALRFSAPALPAAIALELATSVPGQRLTVSFDGIEVGTMDLPEPGRHAQVRFAPPEAARGHGLHTITLAATQANQDGVAILLYRLAL